LNAISGLSELLLKEQTTSTQRDYLQTIQSATESLLYLINDLLDFSKIEAGKLVIVSEVFKPAAELSRVVTLFDLQAQEKGITLECLIDESVPDFIESDLNRFKQVAVNLISNAIKFTNQGGVRIRLHHKNSQLKLRVIDSGCGIEKSKQQEIFSAFEQISTADGGTGLGLNISNKICALMGGQIVCWSKINLGSVFTASICVNTCDKGLTNELQQVTDNQSISGLKVLVAEDNLINRKVISAQLESLGVVVTLAEDGRKAMEKLKEHSYDLILLDNQMPNMNGIETLNAIRSSESRIARHPCIVLTASAFSGEKERFLGLGFDAYLSKPVLLDELSQTLIKHAHHLSDNSADSVMDKTYFERQFGTQSDQIVKQILPVFIEQSSQDIVALKKAIQAQENQKVKALAHSLKGAAASVGAIGLAEHLAILEQLQSQETQLEEIKNISEIFDLTCNYFKNSL